MAVSFLDKIPLWAIFSFMFFTVILSIYLGYFCGSKVPRRNTIRLAAPVGTITAALLALSAFILAFLFGMDGPQFQERRNLLLSEINAIETTYLRAGLIAEPYAAKCRDLLRQYAAARATEIINPAVLRERVKISEDIQKQLWAQAEEMVKAGSESPVDALFIASLNELIDLHTARLTVGGYRIPLVVWVVLVLLTAVAMLSVGYLFGLSGRNSFITYCFLAVGFSLVITMIADLDSPIRGTLIISQQPMTLLQQRLSAP